MKRNQNGFTMIELIVVIVILGVLAATALPKFVDVQSNAETAALNGVAGAMASAMTVNYGGCLVTNNNTAGANASKCRQVDACSDVASLLQGGALPSGYSVAATVSGTEPSTNGTTASCTVTQTKSDGTTATATFDGIGAGN